MAVDVALDGHEALPHSGDNATTSSCSTATFPASTATRCAGPSWPSGTPHRVLMLTAAGTIGDRVDGLGLGADDYLPKPFAFAELIARVRALAAVRTPALPPTLTHGDLALDPARRVATRGGRRLPLTPKEFAVLEHLLAAEGRVVSVGGTA